MAVSAKMFGLAIVKLFNAEFYLNATSNYLKIKLLTSAAVPNQDTWSYMADVPNEVAAGNGYTQGGQNLQNVKITYDAATNTVKIDADDVTWPTSTITARYALVYDDSYWKQALLCYIDFGEDQSSNGDDFTIKFDAAGICTFTVS